MRITPPVHATDRLEALGKGCAVIVQDSGQIGNGTDADWLRTLTASSTAPG